MPRPALPRPGFSLLRLHNTQNPHRITTLSPSAKTNLVDSVAQDIEGCIYAIGYYADSGVLDAENTLQFDQVIQNIKSDERRALRKMFRKMRAYKKEASRAKTRYKKIMNLIKKERVEQEQQHQQNEQGRPNLETDLKPNVDLATCAKHEFTAQASISDQEECILGTGFE
ncbi:hypothetical protein PISL3812_07973 [Talaromyces islandicus]|uniref:Uncharacterized protein n=1 Tax=Talaromyces islandicus TaxID=28573 RepID=A0A0U1M5W8_TALIS|nr:hypothetical protein PISL3812_07973 [Talaromyces islandicus]